MIPDTDLSHCELELHISDLHLTIEDIRSLELRWTDGSGTQALICYAFGTHEGNEAKEAWYFSNYSF